MLILTSCNVLIYVHSNETLTQELEDLQIEEASLRYHVHLLEEIYNTESES